MEIKRHIIHRDVEIETLIWVTGNKPFKFFYFETLSLQINNTITNYIDDCFPHIIYTSSDEEAIEIVSVFKKFGYTEIEIRRISPGQSIYYTADKFLELSDCLCEDIESVFKSTIHVYMNNFNNLFKIIEALRHLGYKTAWESNLGQKPELFLIK